MEKRKINLIRTHSLSMLEKYGIRPHTQTENPAKRIENNYIELFDIKSENIDKLKKELFSQYHEKYVDGFDIVRTHPATLLIPYTSKSAKVVFVNSISDLFHKDVPLEFIKQVFHVMNDNPQHIFQVLTKRADRLFELHKELKWAHTIGMGVSVENKEGINRVGYLRKTKSKVKFLSLEPLLGSLGNPDLKKIDWVIAGGESEHNARAIELKWITNIQEQCETNNVPFFFKQWGGKNKKAAGRLLEGKTYSEAQSC